MLSGPKKTKFRKTMRRVKFLKHVDRGVYVQRKANSCNKLSYGEYGIKIIKGGYIEPKHIEMARVTLKRTIDKEGVIFLRVFPHKPITAKAAESRMGGGKGSVIKYVASVKSGTILFEIKNVTLVNAEKACKQIGYKLPLPTELVVREGLCDVKFKKRN